MCFEHYLCADVMMDAEIVQHNGERVNELHVFLDSLSGDGLCPHKLGSDMTQNNFDLVPVER